MEELIERSIVAREQWESEGQMVQERLCGLGVRITWTLP